MFAFNVPEISEADRTNHSYFDQETKYLFSMFIYSI